MSRVHKSNAGGVLHSWLMRALGDLVPSRRLKLSSGLQAPPELQIPPVCLSPRGGGGGHGASALPTRACSLHRVHRTTIVFLRMHVSPVVVPQSRDPQSLHTKRDSQRHERTTQPPTSETGKRSTKRFTGTAGGSRSRCSWSATVRSRSRQGCLHSLSWQPYIYLPSSAPTCVWSP